MTDRKSFQNCFYPGISEQQWNDWKWQIAHRLTSFDDFRRILTLTKDEENAMLTENAFPVAITPYYASLLKSNPIRRTVLPSMAERNVSIGESNDPLGEEPCMVSPGLVHRYPDRVLFLATDYCSTYCRYCTRSRLVGKKEKTATANHARWEKAFEYIRSHKEVRDVLISGGDPLTLPDEEIEFLLSNIRAIPHVEMIRIGTKTPVVLPMRFTTELLNMIRKYHPVFFSIHFTHPDEMTLEAVKTCEAIADAGIPMGSQTVLLKGINDSTETLKNLMHRLLKARVRPYYLLQCDPIEGSMQFRVPLEKGLNIISELRGHTSGYAVPTYAIDIPGGGGKIVVTPQQCVGRDGDFLLLRNFEGNIYRYPDPQ